MCQHCSQSLTLKHGFKCESMKINYSFASDFKSFLIKVCGFMCHTNCREKVPTKCGINEKQISDILNVIHIGNTIRKPRKIIVRKFVFK